MNTNNYFDQVNLKNQPEPSKLTQFLWWCAGADSYFMKQSPKQDRVKYSGIGGVVLTTGVLASLSGFLAFKTAFGTKGETALDTSAAVSFLEYLALGLGGILWGLIIFNLDRFIISSTGKGDGTDVITRKEWGQAAPRIIIAAILGIVLSAPLETQILKSDIDQELHRRQDDSIVAMNKVTEAKFKQQRIDFERNKSIDEAKLAFYEKELAKYDAEISDLTQQVRNQMENGKVYGFGPVAKKLQENVDQKKQEKEAFIGRKKADIELIRKHIADSDKELANLLTAKQKSLKNNELEAKKMDGILTRIDIAHEKGPILSVMLLLVFLCIETGPIIFKLMMTKGVYDYMVENYNHKINAENGIFTEDYVFEGRDGLVKMEKHVFLEHEEAIHEKKLKSQAQRELSAETIKGWTKNKLEEIKKDPSKNITEGQNSIDSNRA
jgi:hypothetical protein